MQTDHLPPLLAIIGPTAVGKTAYAIELAQRYNGEIVSADSRQVYQGMEIGTAQPSPDELAAVPHHLFGFLKPDDEFSLGTYVRSASAAIADITQRGKLPILVGGTGQYVAAVLEGWQVPEVAPHPELRAELEAQAEAEGHQVLYERLLAVDPAAAEKIAPTNLRRVIRALEVYLVTGQPISVLQRREPPPYRMQTRWITREREQLYERIDRRVDQMMQAGLLGEVQALVQAGYGWELSAMSSLGYIQFRPYLEGETDLESCVTRLKFDTHAFARRQDTWFRRLPYLVQMPADQLRYDSW
jgi:tRNA dimethylallyltransferase